jgi:hypothetical protein
LIASARESLVGAVDDLATAVEQVATGPAELRAGLPLAVRIATVQHESAGLADVVRLGDIAAAADSAGSGSGILAAWNQ